MVVLNMTAEYERNPSWSDTGVHGTVTVQVGRSVVARIPCRYNSAQFEDYEQTATEITVAAFFQANMPVTDVGV